MTGGPSIVFSRKAVVDQTHIRNSENISKSIVVIDASHIYPFSMCQEMPSDFNTRWEFDSDSQNFKTRQNRSRKYEHKVISYLQSLDCTIESYCKTEKIVLILTDFVLTVKLYSRNWAITSYFIRVSKQEQVCLRQRLKEGPRSRNMTNWDKFIAEEMI